MVAMCPACGGGVEHTDKFCQWCGVPLAASEDQEPETTSEGLINWIQRNCFGASENRYGGELNCGPHPTEDERYLHDGAMTTTTIEDVLR